MLLKFFIKKIFANVIIKIKIIIIGFFKSIEIVINQTNYVTN